MSLLERYTQPAEQQIATVSHTGEIPSGQPTCTIRIDGQEVTAIPGEAILRAAQRAGFTVPTLCDDERLAPAAACRMCLVEIEGYDRPMPSCHLPVEAGMVITQASDSLFKLRRQNLEYLLSDHNAYCMPPCQISCPTHIDIPGYLELMAKGQHVEAARLVKEVLPFPYALGLVCPAPCQEVCRRGLVEEEIAIRQCHGYGGELSLEMEEAPTPFPQEPATGKRVAVIGAGPAGAGQQGRGHRRRLHHVRLRAHVAAPRRGRHRRVPPLAEGDGRALHRGRRRGARGHQARVLRRAGPHRREGRPGRRGRV